MTLANSTIRAFVPGGRAFAASKAFYAALGFEQTFDAGDVVGYRHGHSEFLLQDFWREDHANNFMMQLIVEDLDAWWQHIEALELPERFDVPRPRAPEMMPWGLREIHLIGPSGELWHIVQA